MEVFLFAIFIAGFSGAFIGRTIAKESIFEATMLKLRDVLYDDCDEDDYHENLKDNIYKEANLNDGYRLDLDRWKSLTLGKAGDLITCPKCLGVWSSNAIWAWLYVFWEPLSWNWGLSIPAMLVSGAIIYILHPIFAVTDK